MYLENVFGSSMILYRMYSEDRMSPKSREIMTANKGNGIMFMSMRVNVKLPKIQRNVDNENIL